MNEIITKIKEKQQLYKFKTELLNSKLTQEAELKEKIKDLQLEAEKADNIMYACRLLLEKLIFNSKMNLESFLTFALKQIFTDRDYAIKLNLKEESKRPGLEMLLVENGIEQTLTDSVGGGILSTLGLLLQIYYIEAYGLSKVMFIDEGLKEVSKIDTSRADSKDYLAGILSFLKWLSTEHGYIFVIVTHDTDVVGKADKVYKVYNGTVIEAS